MTKFKKIAAAAIAAVSIGAISVTASAATIYTPPVSWQAKYAQGAPTSVNKTYYYPIYVYGNGYDISCTSYLGDYDRNVVVRKQYYVLDGGLPNSVDEKVTDLHAETSSPIYIKNPTGIYGDSITFSFKAESSYSCDARGVISYH